MKNSKALALAAGLLGVRDARGGAGGAQRQGGRASLPSAARPATARSSRAARRRACSTTNGGTAATTRASRPRSATGRLDAGMPPFGAAMSEQEIRALVIFIREKADEARRAKTVFAKPQADTVVKSEEHAFKVETVAEGLDTPWSIAFLPDGRMLVTEKPGRLRIVEPGKPPQQVLGVPAVWSVGQGGLLDVAVHPDYATNGWIYLSYTHGGPDASAMTRVMRARLKGGALVDQETLYAPPVELYRSGPNHFGSRFVFDGKGYLFFTIGERDQQGRRAGPLAPERQGAPHLRRRPRAGGQPVRQDSGRLSDDLELRAPQPAGPRAASRDGRALRRRARPARRRRDQPRRARAQLRLAGHHLRHELRRHRRSRTSPPRRAWSSR